MKKFFITLVVPAFLFLASSAPLLGVTLVEAAGYTFTIATESSLVTSDVYGTLDECETARKGYNSSTYTTNPCVSSGGNTPVTQSDNIRVTPGDNIQVTQGFSASTKIENPLKYNNFSDFVAGVTLAAVQVLMPFIVLAFIYSGFLFVSAQGNEKKLEEAKKAIWYSIIGAFVLLGAWSFAQIISRTVSLVTQ